MSRFTAHDRTNFYRWHPATLLLLIWLQEPQVRPFFRTLVLAKYYYDRDLSPVREPKPGHLVYHALWKYHP